jgi:hypothetical protein
MGGSTAEALGQFQDVFDRQLLDHFMCFPILYPNDRPVSNAVDGEHDLVFVEEPALVDGFGGLDQLPALRCLRRRKLRRVRKRVDRRAGKRYYHLEPVPKANGAFVLCLSVMNGRT